MTSCAPCECVHIWHNFQCRAVQFYASWNYNQIKKKQKKHIYKEIFLGSVHPNWVLPLWKQNWCIHNKILSLIRSSLMKWPVLFTFSKYIRINRWHKFTWNKKSDIVRVVVVVVGGCLISTIASRPKGLSAWLEDINAAAQWQQFHVSLAHAHADWTDGVTSRVLLWFVLCPHWFISDANRGSISRVTFLNQVLCCT